MKITLNAVIPKNFEWIARIARDEYSKTLASAAEGQYREIGRQFAVEDALASGETWKSFQTSPIEVRGDRMQVSLYPTGDRAKVMAFIEFGRRPGKMPPPAAIREWLEAKGWIGKGEEGTHVDAIIWSVARGIGEYGIEPKHLLEKAENRYKPNIVRMFEAATRRIARRVNSRLKTKSTIRKG